MRPFSASWLLQEYGPFLVELHLHLQLNMMAVTSVSRSLYLRSSAFVHSFLLLAIFLILDSAWKNTPKFEGLLEVLNIFFCLGWVFCIKLFHFIYVQIACTFSKKDLCVFIFIQCSMVWYGSFGVYAVSSSDDWRQYSWWNRTKSFCFFPSFACIRLVRWEIMSAH